LRAKEEKERGGESPKGKKVPGGNRENSEKRFVDFDRKTTSNAISQGSRTIWDILNWVLCRKFPNGKRAQGGGTRQEKELLGVWKEICLRFFAPDGEE